MPKFTFEKKTHRRISSEEKAKILAEREAKLRAEMEEELKKRLEDEKQIIDDDEDIEIEDIEEKEIRKNYDSIVSRTKSSKTRILLKFLEQKCKSIREVINIEDEEIDVSSETDTVEQAIYSSKSCRSKGSYSKSSYSKSSGSGGFQFKSSTHESSVKEQSVESFKLDKESYLIYGAVQSGKTQFLQGIAIAHIVLSRCPVIVILRNCKGDAQQLSNRFTDFIKEQNHYFRESGIPISSVLKYFYVGGNKSEDSLRRAFANCNMIVAIANKTQLKKLAKVITPGVSRYATVIDEADSVAYGEDDVEFRNLIHECILANSGRTYAITATTFNIIFTEEKISSKNIIRLPIKKEYRGLEKIQMKVIDPKNDSELEDYLKLLSERNVYEHKVDDSLHRGLKKTDHPMIMLIKKFHRKSKQQELARQVVEIGNWSEVIVFNGDGLTMYSKHIESLARIIREGVVKQNSEGGILFNIKPRSVNIENNDGKFFLTVKAQIDEGLQYYKELHSLSKSTRISHLAIVSEGMADRGISFVSKDYKWHLTTQYYEPSKKAFADNIIQSIRLCGNYNDDLPSVLYSTEEVCNDLAKCFLVQEEMLIRCKASEKVKSIPRVLRKMKLSSQKVPEKRKFGVKECILKNVVEGEDGGVEIGEYNKMLEAISRQEVDRIKGSIYTVDIEALDGAMYKAASDVVDKITESNKWVDRKRIIDILVDLKVYKLNTIRSYLTRIQQSVLGTNTIGNGLNFREKSNGEIEMLYKPF